LTRKKKPKLLMTKQGRYCPFFLDLGPSKGGAVHALDIRPHPTQFLHNSFIPARSMWYTRSTNVSP